MEEFIFSSSLFTQLKDEASSLHFYQGSSSLTQTYTHT